MSFELYDGSEVVHETALWFRRRGTRATWLTAGALIGMLLVLVLVWR